MSLLSLHNVVPPKLRTVQHHLGSNWQAEAISLYQQARRLETATLRTGLAVHVQALTGNEVEASSIYVDLDERFAQVVLDGVMFRWRPSGLTILRPCAACESGRFESPALHSAADLGYALGVWQPLHASCQPEDPADWLYRDN